jgi:hypothetical protein
LLGSVAVMVGAGAGWRYRYGKLVAS